MHPEETVDYHIKSSWHSISRMYNQLASSYNLTQAAGYVLMMIDEHEGTYVTKIGPLLGMEPTSMTRLLKSMENEGLIVRIKEKGDKRKVKVWLTKEGLEKRVVVRKVVKRFNKRILKTIGEGEFGIFKDIIQKVNRIADECKNLSIDKI
jgi:DNA-binding MarR family transcriptional regulator